MGCGVGQDHGEGARVLTSWRAMSLRGDVMASFMSLRASCHCERSEAISRSKPLSAPAPSCTAHRSEAATFATCPRPLCQIGGSLRARRAWQSGCGLLRCARHAESLLRCARNDGGCFAALAMTRQEALRPAQRSWPRSERRSFAAVSGGQGCWGGRGQGDCFASLAMTSNAQ